jgi:hypothetical protein
MPALDALDPVRVRSAPDWPDNCGKPACRHTANVHQFGRDPADCSRQAAPNLDRERTSTAWLTIPYHTRHRPEQALRRRISMRAAVAVVIAGTLIAIAILVAFRWQITAAPGIVYRLDRWTGNIVACELNAGPCYSLARRIGATVW